MIFYLLYLGFTHLQVVTTNNFAGKGKVKVFKLMMNSTRFVTLSQHLGRPWELQEEDKKELQIFTCRLYESFLDNINDARYKIYCRKFGKATLTALPPRQNTLYFHNKRQTISVECGKCAQKQTQRSKTETSINKWTWERFFALIGWTVNLHQSQ